MCFIKGKNKDDDDFWLGMIDYIYENNENQIKIIRLKKMQEKKIIEELCK